MRITGSPQSSGQLTIRVQDYDLALQEESIEITAGEPAEAIVTKLAIVLQELLTIHERHLILQGAQLIVGEFFSKDFYAQSVLVLQASVPGLTITMRARSRDTAFLTTAFFTEKSSDVGRAGIDLVTSRLSQQSHFELAVSNDTAGEALWEPLSLQMRAAGWVTLTVPTWGLVVTNLTIEDQMQASTNVPGVGVGLYRLDPESVLYPFGCDNCNRQGSGGG